MSLLNRLVRKFKKPNVKPIAPPTLDEVAKREVDLAWSELPAVLTRKVTFAVVHCSATPNDRDIGAADIKIWHMQRGFDTIGYHFVIRRNGVVELGRNINVAGAHVEGHNTNSIGICMVGLDSYTNSQWASLKALVARVKITYAPTGVWLKGHYEFTDQKTCPNIDMNTLRSEWGIK